MELATRTRVTSTETADEADSPFDTPAELIEDIRRGGMIVLLDDEDRENEGDLVVAASLVRDEDINFMARFGRGLICLALTEERCSRLALPLMVRDNWATYGTKFTVSVDAASGITTGISAHDRAITVRAAVADNARPSDLVQPGHVFPLMAERGGVLNRAGHTEAACDLGRLAGLEPAGVVCEILNDDGTMARRPDLEHFARKHGLKIGSIADLIHYRVLNEQTVRRVGECVLPTVHGDFRLIAYQDTIDHEVHLALVMGGIEAHQPTLIRVHVQDTLVDLTGAQTDDAGWPLADALRRVSEAKSGVVVILRNEPSSDQLIRRIYRYQQKDEGNDVPAVETGENLRTYGLGAQILRDLGVGRMRVLSAPKRIHGLSGFGLEVVEYIS